MPLCTGAEAASGALAADVLDSSTAGSLLVSGVLEPQAVRCWQAIKATVRIVVVRFCLEDIVLSLIKCGAGHSAKSDPRF